MKGKLNIQIAIISQNEQDFPGGSVVKNLPANGDMDSIPGLGRSHMPQSN